MSATRNVPAARAKTFTTPRPHVNRTKRNEVTVKHKEFIGSVMSPRPPVSSDGLLERFPVNTTNEDMFPWLYHLGSLYEYYKFEHLSVEWTPSVGTTTKGSIVIAADHDPEDDRDDPITRQRLMANAGAKTTQLYNNMVWTMDCSNASRATTKHFSASPNTTDSSERLDNAAVVYVGIYSLDQDLISPTQEPIELGVLTVSYTVKLYMPQAPPTSLTNLTGLIAKPCTPDFASGSPNTSTPIPYPFPISGNDPFKYDSAIKVQGKLFSELREFAGKTFIKVAKRGLYKLIVSILGSGNGNFPYSDIHQGHITVLGDAAQEVPIKGDLLELEDVPPQAIVYKSSGVHRFNAANTNQANTNQMGTTQEWLLRFPTDESWFHVDVRDTWTAGRPISDALLSLLPVETSVTDAVQNIAGVLNPFLPNSAYAGTGCQVYWTRPTMYTIPQLMDMKAVEHTDQCIPSLDLTPRHPATIVYHPGFAQRLDSEVPVIRPAHKEADYELVPRTPRPTMDPTAQAYVVSERK